MICMRLDRPGEAIDPLEAYLRRRVRLLETRVRSPSCSEVHIDWLHAGIELGTIVRTATAAR